MYSAAMERSLWPRLDDARVRLPYGAIISIRVAAELHRAAVREHRLDVAKAAAWLTAVTLGILKIGGWL